MTTTTHHIPGILGDAGQSTGALSKFTAEVSAFFSVILHPRKAIREGEQMQALYSKAYKVEASDPARAAALRAQASRIGR